MSPIGSANRLNPARPFGGATFGPMVAPLRENKLMVKMLGLYAFLLTVPVAELIARHGIRTFAPVFVFLILAAGLMGTGRVAEFFKIPFSRPYMIFFVLAFLAAGMGIYPSRSLETLLPYGLRFHVIPIMCCAMIVSTKEIRKVISWIGVGALVLLVLCILFGEMRDDRLIIKDTTLENPNDLGFSLVFAMTGLLVFRAKILRIISLLSFPVFLLYILKTGSRADLITLVSLVGVASLFAPSKWRIAILLGMPVIAGATFVAVPADTRARLLSSFMDTTAMTSNATEVKNAGDSQEARAQLQLRALQLAVRHPLLGVGTTNFEDAVEEMVETNLHAKSGWQVAHNTYLQIAADNGFPAFICYIWVLVGCFRLNYKSYKLCLGKGGLPDAIAPSFALIMMTVMYMVCTSFSNNSFDGRFNWLVGLTAANFLAVQRERAALVSAAASASPVTGPFPRRPRLKTPSFQPEPVWSPRPQLRPGA